MVLANEPHEIPAVGVTSAGRVRARAAPASPSPAAPTLHGPTRTDALRRIAADVSGELHIDRLFEHVIDEAFALFGVDRAGLWTYHDDPTPLRLAAQRGLSDEMLEVVARLPRDAATSGMTAMRERRVTVLDGDLVGTVPELQRMYRAQGIRTMCYVPIVVGDDVLGLLVLYHRSDYPWSSDEMDLARAFGDQIAIAMRSTRLAASTRSLAERLRSISELAGRLARQQDANTIARTIVGEARRVVEHDTIRVYRVDHESGMCEPIAFQGTFLGTTRPDPASLRTRIGEGLTGWVAANNQILRIGDASADPRSVIMGEAKPESMLIVPMTYEDIVQGVIVVSRLGRDLFDADDETTFSIFAGYAAQALVNASNRTRLMTQQVELDHQLATQQRLLQVNERLLSTLEPASVLDLIADSLKAIVPFDSLSIYEVDRVAGVRRAIIARDRFADMILAHESPLGVGINGWVADHGEALLSNDAHLDLRSVQVPGTPFEPESMIVVPLIVDGDVVGTLSIGRIGEAEAHFSANEFELTKLFAGQASIALRNARTHGEVQIRAEHDALTGLRNHGAFQRELGEAVERGGSGKPFAVLMMDLDAFKGFNDSQGHPAGDALLVSIAKAMEATVRDDDRLYRYGGDEFAAILPATDRVAAHDVADRVRRAVAAATEEATGPTVTISVGVACFPDDGRVKGALVTVADQAMYLAKPANRSSATAHGDDPYLRALDETALALLDHRDADVVLETILTRACALLGTPHGFVFIAESDGSELVIRHGTGLFLDGIGHRQTVTSGLGGEVYLTGKPVSVDDYDDYVRRAGIVPPRLLGAVVGVPLSSGDQVVGVIGLASGSSERIFGKQEIDALSRFAQLASIALDNARLVDAAQQGALYDPITGLPNRELLTDRIAHSLTRARPDDAERIAVILLDLDRFKVINESVGHAVGDRLLVAVGHRLASCLRPGDTVARFGGDEFGIILDAVAGADEARRIADRLVNELRAPFPLGARDWFISASVGIALGRVDHTTPEDLLREAEIARVRAKADPTQRHALFEPSMSTQTLERVDLENDLRRGIEQGDLRLHYQPIIDLRTELVIGFEALVRWQHPERGLVQPGSFIPLAEDTGLILPLGRWVLGTACRQAAEWTARSGGRSLVMSVNLSARQFMQAELADDVAAILAEAGLDANALELEITESVVMDQSEAGIRMLKRLRSMGVRLVLDDFGTGYSSLSYLKHLPLDTIKIDRSFVAGLDDSADRSIVRAVVGMADGLGLGVVAEGIETVAQQRQLLELGCHLGQGYLFSRPVPADEAARLLPRRRVSRPSGRPAKATVSSGSRRKGGA